MKSKGFWYDALLIGLVILFSAVFIGVTAVIEPVLAIAEGAVALFLISFAVIRVFMSKRRFKRFLIKTTKKLDYTDPQVLSSFPFPVAVSDMDGRVAWCSERFINEILGGVVNSVVSVSEVANELDIETLINEEETTVLVNERYYSVYTHTYTANGEKMCILFYLNNTRLKQAEIDYFNSRPYAVLIELDSLDDARTEYRDSEKTEIKSQIEAAIDNWTENFDSVVKRISDDRYLIVTEQINFNRMVEDRFSIIETVRNFEYKGKKIGSTLSVGVSSGKTIKSCEQKARKAIEMALGRGGDQVAIKNKDGYDFIGGVSQSSEKKTKVRSRVIAAALCELIKGSSNVLIMGHSFTDLDAVGAALGVACAVDALYKPVNIVIDREKTLARSLVDKIDSELDSELIIGKQKALQLIGKKTLLIIVDTHIESFVEFSEIYEKIETKVIIDHHRRTPTDVYDAVLFHLDPSASSASEMVTEILQYIPIEAQVNKTVAEALLSGIMLDTKNFVIRSGVRTFEAAAYLKEKGADTVAVKLLFSNSMEVNKFRNRVVSASEIHAGCAVSVADFSSPDIRIICAQAADELLSVSDIKASFVMYNDKDMINISARSYGQMNVQLIMEALGGGGHRTMAACQLKNMTIANAKESLFAAIDNYIEKNS